MRHDLALYRSDQVRALDREAITGLGIDAYDLMQRAGQRVFQCVRARWPEAQSVTVCCGPGNNGGDGWVVARLALEAGWQVQVLAARSPDALEGVAKQAHLDYIKHPLATPVVEWAGQDIQGKVVVDALLGTGLTDAVAEPMSSMIERMNQSPSPVVAVDLPSGLLADTGCAMGPVVEADTTVTFIGLKRGLFTGKAGRYVGSLVFADLQLPDAVYASECPDAGLISFEGLRRALPQRVPDHHKGDSGRVLVVGGDDGMVGAPILAGLAALQTGAGWVELMGREALVHAAMAASPALMAQCADDVPALSQKVQAADVVALGPGLGLSDWSEALYTATLSAAKRLVLDADGLNCLAKAPSARSEWILTPHPGEAARLLGTDVEGVEKDRFDAARCLAKAHGAVVVLKGHGTLVADPEGRVSVCHRGTPAMASAGMGDALTGVVASLWAQGMNAFDAAQYGVLIHATAGEQAAQGKRQIVAPELIDSIAHVMSIDS